MRSRLALVLAVASILVATAVAVALVARDDAPRVATEGRIRAAGTTSTTTAPAVTYPTATTIPPARPVAALHLPSIGVNGPVVPVGVKPGTNELDVPQLDTVGWYSLGPSPGQDGSAVMAGHVDGQGREGIFFRLGRMNVGDPVRVDFADGTTAMFRVVGRQQVPKTQLPTDLFSRAGPPRLTLITCGGAFNSSTRHYVDNVVVVAEPVR